MTVLDIKKQFDPLLKRLVEERNLDTAESVVSAVLGLLNIKPEKRFLSNIPRIDAELSRFEIAPDFARQAAAFRIPNDKSEIIDPQLFWVKKTTKTNLSWLIGVTPNFEDTEANDYKAIGIDFVVPSSCDSVIVLLSNRYKIRSLELKGHLTHTQFEIFTEWKKINTEVVEDLVELKKEIHSRLWESFNFEPTNRKFYLELVEHFSLLVHHLEKTFDRKPSVMFTTRLLGRILFIWFLRKKNLINQEMEYFNVENPLNQTDYYRNKLETLFFETLNREIVDRENGDKLTPYLNGGLFDISKTDFHDDERLTIPSGYFNQLFETLNKYNFTVDESSPEFQQVAIDPEMLGRIFESLLSEEIDETSGTSKKKATGAFYTPREIVNYMCEQSVIEYLKNKIPESIDRNKRLEELIKLPETIFRDQDQNKRRDWKPYSDLIIKALEGDGQKPLTILDPAVGSGAFPMGMLHLLTKIYGRLDPKYEKNISKLKRSILSKSLYGVDIEQTAIEICRLRAWLSIIVDIPEGDLVEPLPNLDFKFTCANTLVALEDDKQASLFEDQDLKQKLMVIRDEYFSTSKKTKKQKLQNEYESLTHREDLFDTKRTKQLKSYQPFDVGSSSSFYDPELHHGVSTFDIVIANPPYLSEKDNAKIFKTVNESQLGKLYHQGKMNFWYYFLHFSLNVLNPNGHIAFITSRYWINSQGAKKLINRIQNEASLVNVVDIGKLKVFDDVAGHHMIAIYSNKKEDEFQYKRIQENLDEIGSDHSDENIHIEVLRNSDVFKNNEIIFLAQDLAQNSEKTIDTFYDMSQGVVEASDKISSKQLGKLNLPSFKVGQGVFVLSEDEVNQLSLNKVEKGSLVKYLDPNEVNKWKVAPSKSKWLIYSDGELKNKISKDPNFSSLKKHLDLVQPFITSSNKPYGLHRPRDIKYFDRPKIIFKGMFVDPEFAIDEENYFVGMSFISIIQRDEAYSLEYLVGILNSKYAFNWFNIYGKKRGAGVDIGVNKLRTFPLPNSYSKMIELKVREIMRSSLKDKTTLENELNVLVYKNYELTYQEIVKIDKSFTVSESEYNALILD
jgi:adenine-specific DNA-methyltransferase